jgi:hypothetical protein
LSSVEYAQRTNTTSTSAQRACSISSGSRFAICWTCDTSRPPFATKPSVAQKSFCMSTIISAVCDACTFSINVVKGATCAIRRAADTLGVSASSAMKTLFVERSALPEYPL